MITGISGMQFKKHQYTMEHQCDLIKRATQMS